MAWSVTGLQTKSAGASGATTINVTTTGAPVTGNKLIAFSADGNTSTQTITSVKDSNAVVLQSLATASGTATDFTLINLAAYDVPASVSSTFTATFSDTGGHGILVQEVSGLLAGNTTAMLDGTAGTNASTQPTSATYSSTAANEFLVTCCSDPGVSSTMTIPATYTADASNINASSNANDCVGYKNSTNGPETASWTATGTDEQAVITVAFKLAGGAAAGTAGQILVPRAVVGPPIVAPPSIRQLILRHALVPIGTAATGTPLDLGTAEADATSTASATLTENLTATSASTSAASANLTENLTGTCASGSKASGVLTVTSTAEADATSTARGTLVELSTAEADGTSTANANLSVALTGTCTATSAAYYPINLLPVAGAVAWYDASQIAGVADSTTIASWSDLSGNGRSVTQATGAKQPTYYSTTTAKLINRLPAVWFDGANGWMQSASFTALAQPGTVFVVAQAVVRQASAAFDGGATRQTIGIVALNGSFYASAGSTFTDGASDTNVHCFNPVFNGASSTFTIDSLSFGTSNAGANALPQITLSGAPSHVALWNGPICEVIYYNTALSTADQATVRAYLINKWIAYTAICVGTSTASATLTEQVAGESDSSSTANANLGIALTGTCASGSAAYGTLSVAAAVALVGTCTASSSASATLTELVTAEADGRSTANASLTESQTATAASGSAAYATLTVASTGRVTSGSAASATLQDLLTGEADGRSSANGTLVTGVVINLVGTCASTSTVRASVQSLVSGEVDATSVAFATALVAKAISGQVTAGSTAQGFLSPGIAFLTPIEFTAGQPQPTWVAEAPRAWWVGSEPLAMDWVAGQPTTAWSATQALFEPLYADNADTDWQTEEPRT